MYIALEIIRFIINAFIITTLVDIVLMGPVFPRFEKRAKCAKFFVTPKAESVKTEKGTYFEFQGAGGNTSMLKMPLYFNIFYVMKAEK